jgi:methionyl aminopeptidase
MNVENETDVAGLMAIGQIVAKCLRHMMQSAEPGMNTFDLDQLGATFLAQHGARSAPILTYKFPGHTCISVNSIVAHGIPSKQIVLKKGDLVNIDVSAELNGYFGDTGGSFGVHELSLNKQKIVDATLRARDFAISQITHGAAFTVVGKSVEKVARKEGFSILEDLQSHGVGRALHEEPKHIPSHFDKNEKRFFAKGMVLTVEPFLTTGPRKIRQEKDGWSLSLPKGHFGAQFEHTLIVTEGAPILTTFLD